MKNQKGFVLIDAMLAIIIIAVALMGVVLGFSRIIPTMATARDSNQAVIGLRQIAEELKTCQTQAQLTDKISNYPIVHNINKKKYQLNISTPALVSGTTNVYQVDIKFNWNEQVANETMQKSITLSNYYLVDI